MSCLSFVSVGSLISPPCSLSLHCHVFQACLPFSFSLICLQKLCFLGFCGFHWLPSLFPHQGFLVPSPDPCVVLWLLLLVPLWEWSCFALSKPSVLLYSFFFLWLLTVPPCLKTYRFAVGWVEALLEFGLFFYYKAIWRLQYSLSPGTAERHGSYVLLLPLCWIYLFLFAI